MSERKPTGGVEVGPLNCPTWCTEPHKYEQDTEHGSGPTAVPLSRYPWTADGDLFHGTMLLALHQESYATTPIVHLVDPEDKAEIHMTVKEAEELANVLIYLVTQACNGAAASK